MRAADKTVLAFGLFAGALCFLAALGDQAFAHDCVARMHNARSPAELLAQTTIEDCMRTGYWQALLTAIAAAMAGGAIAAAVAKALQEQPAGEPPPADWLDGWDIKDPDAFCKLGQRLKQYPGFTAAKTPEQQAEYIMKRMREVAQRNNLRPATGSRLNDLRIGYYRGDREALKKLALGAAVGVALFSGVGALALGATKLGLAGIALLDFTVRAAGGGLLLGGAGGWFGGKKLQPTPHQDREDVAPLKYGGLGNCGEWALALQAAMQCAGIFSQRVAADDDPGKKFSEKHSGTYTTIIVPDPTDVQRADKWKFFDMFMDLSVPNKPWVGVNAEQWMNNFPGKKAFIKDADGNVKAWRCSSCGTINARNASNCRKCKAVSSLPIVR